MDGAIERHVGYQSGVGLHRENEKSEEMKGQQTKYYSAKRKHLGKHWWQLLQLEEGWIPNGWYSV